MSRPLLGGDTFGVRAFFFPAATPNLHIWGRPENLTPPGGSNVLPHFTTIHPDQGGVPAGNYSGTIFTTYLPLINMSSSTSSTSSRRRSVRSRPSRTSSSSKATHHQQTARTAAELDVTVRHSAHRHGSLSSNYKQSIRWFTLEISRSRRNKEQPCARRRQRWLSRAQPARWLGIDAHRDDTHERARPPRRGGGQ